jgi:Bifunctional DNA primase/polymerase, N-terminal
MSNTLLTALAFVRHKLAVFPLHWPVTHNGQTVCSCGRLCGKNAAKHPYARLAPKGLLSATLETGVVKHWWGYIVPEANLGVVTDKLIVIDVDPRHGGDESLRVLEREHGALPPTWRALTGGGGEHIMFACADGIAIASFAAEHFKPPRVPPLGRGVDIRARNGYICAPPSRHICGRLYTWSVDHHPADTPLAPAPEWLVARLTARATSGGKGHDAVQWATRKAGMVSEYRDQAIAQVAGKLLRAVSLDPAFVATLVHDWNTCHCDPPLPEREVAAILDRICEREIRRLEANHA